MFKNLFEEHKIQIKKAELIKYILVFALTFTSFFISEMIFKRIVVGFNNNILVAILSSFAFSSIFSTVYLLIPKFRKVYAILFMFFYNVILFYLSSSIDLFDVSPLFRELFYSNFIREYARIFTFKSIYLLYIIPILIIGFLPEKFELSLIKILKVIPGILFITPLIPLSFSLFSFNNIDSNYLDFYQNSQNLTQISYHYGGGLNLIKNFQNKEFGSLLSVDNYFEEDTIPNRAYNSKSYRGKNIILVDAMGLDQSFITEDVMPFLTKKMLTGTYSNNFYSTPTSIKEMGYYMMDSGVYPSDINQYNFFQGIEAARDNNLTTLFQKNRYSTAYYSNDNSYSYRYHEKSGFQSLNYYDVNNITTMAQMLEQIGPNDTPFYKKITLSNKNVDKYEISEAFASDEELIGRYKSHMYELDVTLLTLFNHLVKVGLSENTVVILFNSSADTRIYDYVNENLENREGLDFYKTPLVFFDNQNADNDVYASFVDFYSAIVDTFDLRAADVEKSLGQNVFHNPFKIIYFPDGSVVSEEFMYFSKTDQYVIKDPRFMTVAAESIVQNKIKKAYETKNFSEIVQNKFYLHLNRV